MKLSEQAISGYGISALPKHNVRVDSRVRLVVTFVFIICVLTVPLYDPAPLVWMFLFPILTSEAAGKGYAGILRRSLWVLLVLLPAVVFNPIYNRETAFTVYGYAVSWGWISLFTVLLRGVLAVQALLVLVWCCGFYGMCRALRGIGCPRVLVTQLILMYRYVGVLLREALTMHRARQARGFGKSSYPLRMWGEFTGQLLLRTMARSRRLSDAMDARGYDGRFVWGTPPGTPGVVSWMYALGWCAAFIVLRFVDVGSIFAAVL